MKTNLTTKQTKKIQNGKLAIYKDIDTAEAREYLLNVLDWLFPNDDSEITFKIDCIKTRELFNANTDGECLATYRYKGVKKINLSQIMYTYNPEQFKPISMPCTQEQWNNNLKPVVEAFGLNVYKYISNLFKYTHSKEYFLTNSSDDGTISYYSRDLYKSVNGKLLPTYSPTEFLEACGIVRVDKVEVIKIEKTNFKMEMQKDGNKVSFSLVVDQTKPIIEWNATKTLCHTITTDQIKTARTNPETLEQLFPKVFEKPVVEVGKWYRNGDTSHKKSVAFLTDYNKSTNHYKGYGFDIDGNWSNGNDNYVWGSSNWIETTLSDLQPLFEAEFNKRYKDGDLLESPSGALRYYYSKGNGIRLFHDGNFAKVIKSAELIKAEEELEQAKKRVEELKGKC